MASIVITIETDGAAFQDNDNVGNEVARILRKLADRFGWCPDPTLPYDSNGNTVGTVEMRD